jgi:hypothetical protein
VNYACGTTAIEEKFSAAIDLAESAAESSQREVLRNKAIDVARREITEMQDIARKVIHDRKIDLVAKDTLTTQKILSEAWQREFGLSPKPYPGRTW